VPGFYLQEKGETTELTIAGIPGLLIPIRTPDKKIRALKIRGDGNCKDSRYTSLSSRKFGGPSPGSPVHVPLFDGDTTMIRITEGELKGDISTILSGVLTISVPGVSNWRPAIPILKGLGTKLVHLAFDADKKTNRMVAMAQADLFHELKGLGYQVEVEKWKN
jgi:hypothetical protein